MAQATRGRNEPSTPGHEVVVIGAGPSGIVAGIKLKQAGIDDFVIVDRGGDLGGTWRDYCYPGIAVDVPVPWYEYSFARNRNWSRMFPGGEEINAYHRRVALEHGLGPHFRFHTEVARQVWDDGAHLWRLTLADGGELTTRFLITAVGAFVDTNDPNIPGTAEFAGRVLQPSRWDPSYDYTGKRVAVVGTGASAVQIVPGMAGKVSRLTVYQRTPSYCWPRPDFRLRPWMQTVLSARPVGRAIDVGSFAVLDLAILGLTRLPNSVMARGMRAADWGTKRAYRAYLRLVLDDPALRRSLAPSYGLLGKRPTASNAYLQAFRREHVELVTDSIERITARGIVSADGVEREFDVIVLATGQQVFSDPEYYKPGMILGRNGFDLGTFYAEHGLQAYESSAVPRVPNRWMISGPYSWGHSLHPMAENVAIHAARAIAAARRTGATLVEVRKDVHDAYHAKVLDRGENLHYYFKDLNRGLRTYYLNSQGQMAAVRRTSNLAMLWRSVRTPLAAYRCETLTAQQDSARQKARITA
ncbi:flavin-containing monooxygenase [Nocardia iowensis]|uniref:NAD(P)/FAD-dependent oxidoreductase n=1 Tax=Nocardia iowensis TaxID=204891 RepID=A0ABX8RYS8_NOCIO|nr:NAD(P)/FAD-dependent oxidoreductase [Nocardia iowensis]QXN94829.1 NAD(P)/FAD-dependent oxidoreductase [Nocardia iowensis]